MKKPNQPEEVVPGAGYSFVSDCKVNGWMFAAMVISLGTDLFYRHEVRDWPAHLKLIAAAAPMVAVLLWIRRLARWIRGMDELHRRITVSTCLFATSTTFFLIATWHHFARLEVLHPLLRGPMRAYATMDLCVPWLILWLLLVFYAVGLRLFTSRYR